MPGKVLVVGDRPSRYNSDPAIAFIGARCWKRLERWLLELGIDEPVLCNRSDIDFKAVCELAVLNGWPVLALGKEAQKECEKQERRISEKYRGRIVCKIHAMEHPSGLNRKLNDKQFEAEMLKKARLWLNNN